MTDIEKQELWLNLMNQKAELCEKQAEALAGADLTLSRCISDALTKVEHALRSLKEARSIRELLTKIEAIGEKP